MPDPITPVAPNPPPSTTVTVIQQVITYIGILMTLVGYGYQSAAANHPEEIAKLGPGADWAAIAGMLITVGGVVSHGITAAKAKASLNSANHTIYAVSKAVDEKVAIAEASPPKDADGNYSARHTVSTAIAQAVQDKDDSFAEALVKALGSEGGGK